MTTVDPTRADDSGGPKAGAAERIRVPAQRGSGAPGTGSPDAEGRGEGPLSRRLLRRAARAVRHPVPAALLVAAVLHVVWVLLLANSGGDLAAQDAWAEFALQHPASAYNLAWYGGMHPVSYSAISPYLMAVLGVRTTMMVAGTLSAGLVALLLVRSRAVRRPMWAALYGTFCLACNAVSGRVTFGLGTMFGLAAVAVVFVWPARWRTRRWHHRFGRAALAGVMAALATMSSPVAGLFVGVVAAALWLTGRRPAAYALGLPPAAVVALSAWLFPFSGKQPMDFPSTILPFLSGVAVFVLVPRQWRTVRVGSAVYALGVVLAWVIPSQVGTNITRLGMIFSGVLLLAALPERITWPRVRRMTADGARWVLVAACVLGTVVWQGVKTGIDIVHTTPSASWARELAPLLDALDKVQADRGRVEVVPVRSHRESSALAPYVNLARGWNRQRDTDRNPLFYEDDELTPAAYHRWLRRMAVHYVVLPADEPDPAAKKEARLIAKGLPYLTEKWSDANWRLYEVADPTQIAAPPATVVRAGADELVITVPAEGPVLIRVPYSPWLGLVDEDGDTVKAPDSDYDGGPPVNRDGCLTKQVQPAEEGQPEDEWTVLHAPHAGTYRIAGRYRLPRGTPCPDDMVAAPGGPAGG
ncbi:MFS transporter [Streptomyces sp. B1866]|uniref:MFS transporter n=1 Tax=Streptomyces sp. B1866 TaxID=3075431 RepID=UPI00288DD39B|nr:MFS transporter [Streptomyces sp. B1866]MDT3398462.1 MFS transporter [Streptomyces sp. B1866]